MANTIIDLEAFVFGADTGLNKTYKQRVYDPKIHGRAGNTTGDSATSYDVFSPAAPSFSEFDAPVISWNLFMGNDIKNEDYLSIRFASIPRYSFSRIKGSFVNLDRAMPIDIRMIDGNDWFIASLLVKEVTYSISGSSHICTLLLSTRKILLDSYPSLDSLNAAAKTKELTLDTFVATWAARQGVFFEGVYKDDEIANIKPNKYIGGRQNVLDAIQEIIQPKGSQPICSLWIDIFNNLHIRPIDGGRGNIKMDFSKLGSYQNVISVNYRMFNSFEERETSIASNIGDPDKKSKADGRVARYDIGVGDLERGIKQAEKNLRAYAEGSSGTEVAGSLKKYPIKDQTLSITFKGIVWFLPHYNFELAGFPIGDADDYIIKSITMSDRVSDMRTVVTLERSTVFSQPLLDRAKIELPEKSDERLARYTFGTDGKPKHEIIKAEK